MESPDTRHEKMLAEDFITQLQSGDVQAFENVIRKYNQRLFRIARAIVRDNMEAEDIVQEAYVKAFTNLDKFGGVKNLGAWLAKITANVAIDYSRKIKRADRGGNDLLEKISAESGFTSRQEAVNTMTPERQVAISQIRALLEGEIDKLPDGFREVFVLRVIEEMSIEETSEVLDLPIATVKSRLHRAREKLQKSLRDQISAEILNVFPFDGVRCDRITDSTLSILKTLNVICIKPN